MPQLGETVTEGTILRWAKQVGDSIAEDEVLVEISTDKVDTEVPSPAAGTILEILVPEGETVEVGTRARPHRIREPSRVCTCSCATARTCSRHPSAESTGGITGCPSRSGGLDAIRVSVERVTGSVAVSRGPQTGARARPRHLESRGKRPGRAHHPQGCREADRRGWYAEGCAGAGISAIGSRASRARAGEGV